MLTDNSVGGGMMFGDPQLDSTNTGVPSAGQPDDQSGGIGLPTPMTPATDSPVGTPIVDDSAGSALPPADELADTGSSSMSRGAQDQTPEDLMSIKQDALTSLKPLVGHLDQTPEERFRMTMMMIQAIDDQSLIPDAYEAAKAIEDEKTRAQALLDVVNEINYFSQQNK